MKKFKPLLLDAIIWPATAYFMLVVLTVSVNHFLETDITLPNPIEVLLILLYLEWFGVIKPALNQLMNEIKDKQNDHSNQNP